MTECLLTCGLASSFFYNKPLERSLVSQKSSLEKLVLNENLLAPADWEAYGDVINLSEFKSLKTLILPSFYLLTYKGRDVVDSLPPNLEEIQVHYDQVLQSGCPKISRPKWLFGILSQKNEHLPKLERMRITILKADVGAYPRIGMEVSRWKPPRRLLAAFDDARVCLSIFVSSRMKYEYRKSYEGVKGFDDHWEDTWRCDDYGLHEDESGEESGEESE